MGIIDLYFMKKVRHKVTGITGLVTAVHQNDINLIVRMTVRTNERVIFNTPTHEWEVMS